MRARRGVRDARRVPGLRRMRGMRRGISGMSGMGGMAGGVRRLGVVGVGCRGGNAGMGQSRGAAKPRSRRMGREAAGGERSAETSRRSRVRTAGGAQVRRTLAGRQRLDARLDLLDQRAWPVGTQRVGGRPAHRRGRRHAAARRRRRFRGGRLVAQDHLARMGELLPLEDRLDDVGVDGRIIAFDPHADGLQLEDEILIGDPHHPSEILDANFSHIPGSSCRNLVNPGGRASSS